MGLRNTQKQSAQSTLQISMLFGLTAAERQADTSCKGIVDIVPATGASPQPSQSNQQEILPQWPISFVIMQ